EEEREPVDFLNFVENLDTKIHLEKNVTLSPASLEKTLTDVQDLQVKMEAASGGRAAAAVFDKNLNRPLARGAGKIGLGDNVEGLAGVSVTASGGDSGAVDQITLEILRQLSK